MQRGLRHARNSDWPNPNRIVTSSFGTFWTALLCGPELKGTQTAPIIGSKPNEKAKMAR
jgi:hypothetical protein